MEFAATLTQTKTRFAPILYSGSLRSSIAQIASQGFRRAELHLTDPAEIDFAELGEALQEHRLQLSTIGTGLAAVEEGLSFSTDDEEIRQRAVERVVQVVDAFSSLKPKIIIGTIKGRRSEASSTAVAEERIADALRSCARHAAAYGMELVLEGINRYEQDYLNSLGQTVELIRFLGQSNIRAHADIFHMNMEETSITGALWRYRDFLGHVHAADNNRLYPGRGGLDFKAILETLEGIRYQGTVALECLPVPDGPTAAGAGLEYLNHLRELIGSPPPSD